jgi:vacuolar protein sorting-associated protein 26
MSYFFSTPLDIDIRLEDSDDNRQMVDVKLDKNRREKCPLYMDGESVKGAVTIRPKDGKRLEHTGIKVQFIGTIGWRPSNRRAKLVPNNALLGPLLNRPLSSRNVL